MTAKEALKKCERIMGNSFDGLYPTNEINKIVEPIRHSLNELEQLKRDVARYFELQYINQFSIMTQNEIHEMYVLRDKLMKVGK